MPFITEDELPQSTLFQAATATRGLNEPAPIPKAPKPEGSLLGAAFRQENLIGAAIVRNDLKDQFHVTDEFDPNFSPRKQAKLDGLGEYADRFNNVRNKSQYDFLKAKIDQEKKDNAIISDNGLLGLTASVFAGIADPVSLGTLLIPGVGEARATSIGARIAGYAGRGAIEAAATEVPLNLMQETRSPEQSALAVAGGAVVHSLLGTAADKVSKARKDKLTADLLAETEQTGLGDSVGAARVGFTTSDSASRLKTNPGVKAVDTVVENTGLEGVGLTVAKSDSPAIRRAGEQLAIDILQREGTAEGRAAPVSAELLVRAGRADLQNFAIAFRDASRSLDGLGQLADSDKQVIFNQLRSMGVKIENVADVTPEVVQSHLAQLVGYAARNSDTHVVSQVEGLAKILRKIYDKDYARAVRLGLVEAGTQVVGAPSYFTRVYNKALIQQRQTEFMQTIVPEIERKLAAAGEPINKAEDIATAITNNLTGMGNGSAADVYKALTEKGYGKLAERILDIPDDILAPFLENDAAKVLSIYKRSVEPQLALKETMGHTDFKKYLDEVLVPEREVEKSKLSARTNMDDPAQVAKLNEALAAYDKNWKQDVAALEQLWKRVEGRATEPPTAEFAKKFHAGARILRKVVGTASLGGTVIASIPDIGRIVMTHGLTPLMKNWAARLTSKEFRDFSKETAARIGTAGELVMYKQSKLRRDLAAEGFDPELLHVEPGRIERAVDSFAERFQYWSGAMWWNDTPRQMAATLAEDRILRNAEKGWSAISQKEREYLAVMGIDEKMLGKIKTGGQVHDLKGFKATDLETWTDQEAARAVKLATLKDATTTINSPTAGTMPVWADNETAKFLLQFKSFIFANYQQTLLVGLQRADAETLMGLSTMVGLGMAVEATRRVMGGNDKDYTAGELVFKGIDRSGVASIPQEVVNYADLATRMTGHTLNPYANARIQDPSLFDILGPTAGYLQRGYKVINDVGKDGSLSDKGQKSAVGLLPYQNLWGFRPGLAALEWAKGQTDYIDRVSSAFKKAFPDMKFDAPSE